MKRTKWARRVALVAMLGLAAAACGDDNGSSTTGATTTQAPSGTTGGGGATSAGTGQCDSSKKPLKIGGVAQVAAFAGIEDGARARIEKANQTCVQGHKLEWVGMRDDGSDSQKNLDALRDLVENQGVFAVIATSANLIPASTNYLRDKKVPYFGWGFMPGFCGSDSWGYGFNGCLSGYALNKVGAIQLQGAKLNGSLTYPNATVTGKDVKKYTLVVLNSGDEAGALGDAQYSALWGSDQMLAKASVPVQGVTDYTQYVNLVKDKNPDVVVVSTDFPTAIKLKAAIIQSGYTGKVVDYVTYIPGLLDSSKDTAAALEGGYSNSQFPPAEDNGPGTQMIAADLQAIGKQPFVTQGASIGYWSADVMVQMLQSIQGDITSDNFRKLAESGWTYKPVDGGIGPISYPDGHTNPAPCAGMVKVEKGKYTSVVKFQCYQLLEPTS
jgi:ABC-type branched-subunit amino acid transport system substrate-binding protein